MDTFRWISVVVSMILGLGVARLLTGGVTLFRARHRVEIDWLPLVWAAAIFVQQIGLWWALEELASLVPKWTFASFLLLVGLVLTLFVAAALVLPSDTAEDDSLRLSFERDGRFALLAVTAFNGIAELANLMFWNQPLISMGNALNAAMMAVPLIAFFGSRRVQAIATIGYLLLALLGARELLPMSY